MAKHGPNNDFANSMKARLTAFLAKNEAQRIYLGINRPL